MKKRNIGNLRVSEIGIACMSENEHTIKSIRKAYDAGCTFFDASQPDTGQLDSFEDNEKLLGEAVKDFRRNVVLAAGFCLEAKSSDVTELETLIKEGLDASLKRMQTDYIDLFYIHGIKDGMPIETVAAVMAKLIKSGLIGGWGLSLVDINILKEAHGAAQVTAVKIPHNTIEEDSSQELLSYCRENNIGVVPISFVCEDIHSIDIIKDFSARKDAAPSQIALAWLLHRHPKTVPLTGGKTTEKILENLGASHLEFEEYELEEFQSALNDNLFEDIVDGDARNENILDIKTKNLLTLTLLITQGISGSILKSHLITAKNNGLSENETEAALRHVASEQETYDLSDAFELVKEIYQGN